MVIVGLTGGIGTGKSTVSRVIARAGVTIIDAAVIGHEVYQPGTETWTMVSQTFGPEILLPDNQVDRKKLGEIVFNDPEAMAQLNAIMRPVLKAIFIDKLKDASNRGNQVAVLDSATLIEAGWTSLVEEVWLVTASRETVTQRLRSRNGLSDEAIHARVASQLTDEERMEYVDAVIPNNGTLEELTVTVEALWAQRIEAKVRNNGAA